MIASVMIIYSYLSISSIKNRYYIQCMIQVTDQFAKIPWQINWSQANDQRIRSPWLLLQHPSLPEKAADDDLIYFSWWFEPL